MPRLQPVTSKKLVKILSNLGFIPRGKMKGSHLMFKHPDGRRTTIPVHGGEIPKGTLSGILRDLDISKEEFSNLL